MSVSVIPICQRHRNQRKLWMYQVSAYPYGIMHLDRVRYFQHSFLIHRVTLSYILRHQSPVTTVRMLKRILI